MGENEKSEPEIVDFPWGGMTAEGQEEAEQVGSRPTLYGNVADPRLLGQKKLKYREDDLTFLEDRKKRINTYLFEVALPFLGDVFMKRYGICPDIVLRQEGIRTAEGVMRGYETMRPTTWFFEVNGCPIGDVTVITESKGGTNFGRVTINQYSPRGEFISISPLLMETVLDGRPDLFLNGNASKREEQREDEPAYVGYIRDLVNRKMKMAME